MTNFGPNPGQVYVDPALENISIAYQNENYIADMVFPEIQVKKLTGFYFVYDKSKFHVVDDQRAPSTRANRVDYGLTKTPYGPLVEHSLEQDIPDEVIDQAVAPLDPQIDATENVTERILLSKEVDAFNQCSNTAVITQNVTLSGGSQWDKYGTSDPIGDVKTGRDQVKANVLKMPNRLLLSYPTFSTLQQHPQMIERIKYSQLGVVTPELIAEIFSIEEVWIAHAEQNTANEAQADSMSYIWGKHAWIFYINPAPAIRKVSFGYTLRRGPRMVERWDERQVKAQFVRVTDWYQQLIIASVAAYFIKNATA